MNAAVSLIEHVLPATVYIRAQIPDSHASSQLLGTERMGSGTIVEPGVILTVNYVVIGASQVRVTLSDNRSFDAEILGHDFSSGLALLRIPERDAAPLPLRRTGDLRLGDDAFMVASVGEGSARVSNGVISSLGAFDANWEYVLERAITTTAMNPGLGGGPLLDPRGQVIGVVSLNLSEIGRFSLAVPADYYLDAHDRLLAGDPGPTAMRAWLGIFCYGMRERVVIAGLLSGGPGERAGLKTGDVIVSVDGTQIADRRSLYRLLWTHRAGEDVTLQIIRGRDLRTITVSSGDVEEFFA